MDYIIEMLNIRKEFPGIVANDDITLQIRKTEIHCPIGWKRSRQKHSYECASVYINLKKAL